MFKLPNPPSAQADTHELADFIELLSWYNDSASQREVVAYLGQIDDNEHNVGCDDDDDENAAFLDDVMNEVERRVCACGEGYPFRLDLEGSVLRHETTSLCVKSVLYRYLLLGTRLNMQSDRVHAGIDGTLLLEEIAAYILQNYLGASRSRSFVFGTATAGGFKGKVDKLCRELGEGECFESIDSASVDANDDKLDTVTWVPFSDRLPGQLILFGQCKTGTNWGGLTSQLQPEAFIKKWIRGTIVVNPLRVFCVSEAADRSRWKSTCVVSGILFDRCRLVDFCDDLPKDLVNKMLCWTNTAKKTLPSLAL